MRVLVTGATGGVGSTVVKQLSDTGVSVRAVSRNPNHNQSPGVEAVAADLAQPESMRRALQDVDAVFLYPYAQDRQLTALVTEMKQACVSKVVVLSTIDTTRSEQFVDYNRRLHLAVENAIAAGGFAYTCLRPGAFARNALRFWAGQIRRDRRVRLPFPESKQAPIDDDDIAAVAVRVLTSGELDSQCIVLTGPQSLSMRQQIGLISEAIGHQIAIETISEADARALYAPVLPPAYLDLLMSQWAHEVGEPAVVTDTVQRITGRAPTDYLSWAMRHRELFL
ncbi:MAG: NAD(P)H-binding protein [Mycobacterium sp.]|nr:NAD(P)H-binding protein [Mycobacterium sp.]